MLSKKENSLLILMILERLIVFLPLLLFRWFSLCERIFSTEFLVFIQYY